MATLMKNQIHAFLHDYKKRVFELDHDPKFLSQRHEQVLKIVKEILGEKSSFHFHQKVDKSNAATLDLIYDFCHEAMLPPVITRLAERIAGLEARQSAALELVTKVLDALAIDESARG